MMKKRNTAKQQMGFFDLGFSLAMLALSGAFAYAATPDQADKVAVQEPRIEVVATLETGSENVELYE
jgi:hypothetical protein